MDAKKLKSRTLKKTHDIVVLYLANPPAIAQI